MEQEKRTGDGIGLDLTGKWEGASLSQDPLVDFFRVLSLFSLSFLFDFYYLLAAGTCTCFNACALTCDQMRENSRRLKGERERNPTRGEMVVGY